MKLNRQFQNTSFVSWKAGAKFIDENVVSEIDLPQEVSYVEPVFSHYTHLQACLYYNYLANMDGQFYTFVGQNPVRLICLEGQNVKNVCEVQLSEEGQLLVGNRLPPSLATVTRGEDQLLLIGDGVGGMHLHNPSMQGALGDKCYPLHLRPPQIGRIAFVIGAAYFVENGSVIKVVTWSLLQKGCKMHCVTCKVDDELNLEVLEVMDLAEAELAPQLVLCNGQDDSVLLGITPKQDAESREQSVSNINEMDEESDPRTLEQAAAKLKQGENVQGLIGDETYMDMYKETGPDGIGAPGNEPKIELSLFSLKSKNQIQQEIPQVQFGKPIWQLALSPHKILTSQNSVRSQQIGYLGVSDDVDCEVLEIILQPNQSEPIINHIQSIPALAYIVAGKTQRKFLLLAPMYDQSSSLNAPNVAAILVEGKQFLYVYEQIETTQKIGKQQVLNIGSLLDQYESGRGGEILGAHLDLLNSQLVLLTSQKVYFLKMLRV